jgi:hypothetical protein
MSTKVFTTMHQPFNSRGLMNTDRLEAEERRLEESLGSPESGYGEDV